MTSVFRFAPSPHGELHLGHAYSALLNQHFADIGGGRMLLRIEDIDTVRSRPHFVAAIFDILHWLGIRWEQPVRAQSQHFDDYRKATASLSDRGLLYRCFASRAEIEAAAGASTPSASDPDGQPLYPGLFRGASAELLAARLSAGEPAALRIDMEKALRHCRQFGKWPLAYLSGRPDETPLETIADPARWGDAVIVRKDTPSSYHLAVVVDDALQQITHVVRGRELEAATDLHCLLAALLGHRSPCYFHHPLITRADGQKLSKSNRDQSLRSLREAGASPSDIRRMVGLAKS